MDDPNTPPKRKTTVRVFAKSRDCGLRKLLNKKKFANVNGRESFDWVWGIMKYHMAAFPAMFEYEAVAE